MGKSLELPYANDAKVRPNLVLALASDRLGFTFWVVVVTSIDQTHLISMFLSLMKSQCSGFSTANWDK